MGAPPAALGAVLAARRFGWIAAAGVLLALTGISYADTGTTGLVCTGAVGLVAAAFMAVGIGLERPRQPLAWGLLAGHALVTGVATTIVMSHVISRKPLPFPSVADWLYLAAFPLSLAGGLLLVRTLGSARSRLAWLDATIISLAFAVPAWVLVIEPLAGTEESTFQRVVLLAHPAGSLFVFVVLVRLLFSPAWRVPAFWLLVGGTGLLVAANILLFGIGGGVLPYQEVVLLYGGFYTCWALAVLHPSVRRLGEPVERREVQLSSVTLVLMLVGVVFGPATVGWEVWEGRGVDLVELGMSTGLAAILLVRMAVLVQDARRLREEEALARAEAESAQRLLSEQNDRLRELDRQKDEFLSLVSHDLRTPLTSILGYADLLGEAESENLSPEEQTAFLDVIQRNGQRLLGMVDDLLFLARLQAGKLDFSFEETDLRDLVEECVQGLQPRAEAADVELALEPGPAAPLVGDPRRLAQLVDNLTSNAIKFTAKGGRVTLRILERDDTMTLEVSDTGIGIAPDELDQLFNRFFRTRTATERQLPGTGLGLTIVKAVADGHHGTISVESAPGVGTTFRVELPSGLRRTDERSPSDRRAVANDA